MRAISVSKMHTGKDLRTDRIPVLISRDTGKVVYDDPSGRLRIVIGPVERIRTRLKEAGYVTGILQ